MKRYIKTKELAHVDLNGGIKRKRKSKSCEKVERLKRKIRLKPRKRSGINQSSSLFSDSLDGSIIPP